MPKASGENDVTRVRHMLDFARKAVQFSKNKSRADLDNDEMLALVTIHLVEVIGERHAAFPSLFKRNIPKFPGSL